MLHPRFSYHVGSLLSQDVGSSQTLGYRRQQQHAQLPAHLLAALAQVLLMTIQNPPPTLDSGGCLSIELFACMLGWRASLLEPAPVAWLQQGRLRASADERLPRQVLMSRLRAPLHIPDSLRRLLSYLPACLPTCLTETSKKHFSKAMRELVSKCLVKDPAKRPTAAQVRRCGAQQYP